MSYENKEEEYYKNYRHDIFSIYSSLSNVNTILEIGCGFGNLGNNILSNNSNVIIDGVELNKRAYPFLINNKYSEIWIGDAFEIIREKKIKKTYDLIILADVLEHISSDIEMIKLVSELLNLNGRLIISVPNVTNWQLIRNLYIKKSFPRDVSGIFDGTHLRWYTKDDIINICEPFNLKLEKYSSNRDFGNSFFNWVFVPFLEFFLSDFFVSQHIVLLKRV